VNLFEYQELAKSTAIYPRDKAMLYPALGLIGECGEVAEKIKKVIRDDDGVITPKRREAIMKELGDCCWYVANICSDTELPLGMIYEDRDTAMEKSIRLLEMPKVVLLMSKSVALVADELRVKYYNSRQQLYRCPHAMMSQISNVLMHIEALAILCGFTLEDICSANIDKLLDRKDRGVLKGDGDSR